MFVLVIIALTFQQGSAQDRRFNAAIVAGFNASQLNGDQSAGYNRIGPTAGLRGIISLQKNFYLSTEILYSQRGSRYPTGLNNPTPGAPLKITTNYVDIPVVFTVMDWLNEESDYYRLHFHAGPAFGRLFKASAEFSPYDDDTNLFSKNDFYMLVGVTYFTNAHLGFTFRYNRSVVLLFSNRKHQQQLNANSLFSHFLTLRAEYVF